MQSATKNARALRAALILVLAFLMAGGGAAPAPTAIAANPDAKQVLAAATAGPDLATAAPSLPAPSVSTFDRSDRRVAEVHVAAVADAAAEARREARAEAKAKAKADAKAAAKARAARQAASSPKPGNGGHHRADSSKPTYSGANHFWMPSLGMNYGVHAYACSRSSALANVVYRWGCAGSNNVYIMGHAWGVMDGLHDAYVRGTLRKGLVAVYANGSGNVTRYAVTEWRVVDPSNSGWAIASQSRPSMTLQTCVGKNGSKRLVVRLVAIS